jgi:hypothetical protein
MGQIIGPETSVQNRHLTLRNIPEEHRSHLHSGGSLKSRLFMIRAIQVEYNSIEHNFKNTDIGSITKCMSAYVRNFT